MESLKELCVEIFYMPYYALIYIFLYNINIYPYPYPIRAGVGPHLFSPSAREFLAATQNHPPTSSFQTTYTNFASHLLASNFNKTNDHPFAEPCPPLTFRLLFALPPAPPPNTPRTNTSTNPHPSPSPPSRTPHTSSSSPPLPLGWPPLRVGRSPRS